MADDLGEIGKMYVKIQADLDGLKKDIDGLKASGPKETEAIGKSMGTRLGKGFSNALLATGILTVITTLFKKSIQAAAEQELAETRLFSALGKTSQGLLDQASALQKVTMFTDDSIITAQSMIAAYEKDEDKVKLLTKSTLDFAAAKKREGMDVVAAGEIIAKTYGSNTNSLKRYGVEVKGVAGSTERLKSITEELAKLYGGQAEDQAKTFTGRLTIMKNKIGEVEEGIGKALIPVLEKLVSQLDTTAEAASKAPEWMQVLGGAARVVANIFTVLKTALVHVGTMIGTIGASLYALFSGNFELIPGIVKDGGDKIVKNFENMWTEITEMWKGLDQKFEPEVEKMVNTFADGTGKIEEMQKRIAHWKNNPGKLDARHIGVDKDWKKKYQEFLDERTALTKINAGELYFIMKEVNAGILDNSMMTTEAIFEDWKEKNREIVKHFDLVGDLSMRAFDEIRIRAAASANATTRFWVDAGNMIINKLKEILTQMLITFAIKSFFNFIVPGAGSAIPIGHSGGNFIGTSNGVKKMAGGGSFIVPPGFPNDSYPLLVESGERVSVTSRNNVNNQDALLRSIDKKLFMLNSNFLDNSMRKNTQGVIPIAGRIEGDDIYITNKKASKIRNRYS